MLNKFFCLVYDDSVYLLPGGLVEVFLHVEVAERNAKVGVDVGRAALPAGSALLQPEHCLRKLEAEIAERAQGHRRHGGEHAPP